PIIPTPVLAESITGRPTDAPANQAISRIGTVLTDEPLACQAGAMRHVAARAAGRRAPSAIDAIVAAHAADAAVGVGSPTYPGDLRRLLLDHSRIRVEHP